MIGFSVSVDGGIFPFDFGELHKFPRMTDFLMKGIRQICDTTVRSGRTVLTFRSRVMQAVSCLINRGLLGTNETRRPGLLTDQWLLEVEQALHEKWNGPAAYNNFLTIRQIFREADLVAPNEISEALSRTLSGRWKGRYSGSHRAASREPYTDGEMARIARACLIDVRETLKRLETEADMLRSVGRDPRSDNAGWTSLANCVWYVENALDGQNLTTPEISRRLGKWATSTTSWLSVQGFRSKIVYSSIYPTTKDMFPFFLLIASKTGINVDSLRQLKRSDVTRGLKSDEVIINFRKPRAAGHEVQKLPISARGWRSPGALLKTYISLSSRLASVLRTDAVWISIQPGRYWGQLNQQGFTEVAKSFRQKHDLKDDAGAPLLLLPSRMRPTHKSAEYKLSGNLKIAGIDHRNDDTTVQYINNRITKDIHEQTISSALVDFHRHFSGCVVPDQATQEEAITIIGGDPGRAKAVMTGEQDVFVASCRDFYHRPGGASGVPCDQPWLCFQCANAVWTARVLPRLMQFLAFIESQRDLLIAEDWERKFGATHRTITRHILPEFSETILEKVRSTVQSEIMYLPLEMKII